MPPYSQDRPTPPRPLPPGSYAIPHRPRRESPRERGTRLRRGWAATALVLSLIAVVVEASFHLCASELFDPLPDVVTGVAYAWVLFFLCFNEAALRAARQPSTNPLIHCLGPTRAAGLALGGTGVALLVAAMVTWMFLPFLAVAPFLVVSVIGSLLLAPCLDLIVLIAQFRALLAVWRANADERRDRRAPTGATLLGLAALFLLVVRPTLIGRWTAQALHATGDSQQRAFTGLRLLHGESTMLDLTYRRNPPYWVCFGYKAGAAGFWPWVGYGWDQLQDDVPTARRVYFLLTGTPFESVPRPDSAARQNALGQPDDVAVEETGGEVVGRPVPGLSLDTSDLEFTVDTPTETTVGAWTMVFRNDTSDPQEARADILLPPGATCHAVSLWIDGVERPASFSAPQKVREAYQQIAVVQRRDPLLVTMPAPDHLLAQCFPVPPQATMRIKLGITAPLIRRSTGRAGSAAPELLWVGPAFGPVNFTVPPRLTHSLTLTTTAGATIPATAPRGADIFSPPTHPLPAPPQPALPLRPVDLWLLCDASSGMDDLLTAPMRGELRRALAGLPAGSHVNAEDTAGRPLSADSLGDRPRYVGGTDPAPALERILRRAREAQTADRPAVVVFLHAASPANVSHLDGARRELQLGANGTGPSLVSIQLAPRAPDAVAMDLASFPAVYARRALPGDDGALSDSLRFAAETAASHPAAGSRVAADTPCPLGGHAPAVNGNWFSQPVSGAAPSEAVTRLWQASVTTAGWYQANAMADYAASVDLRIAAGAPAARARLVTPLTSAVVLETRAQYESSGLDDPNHPKSRDASDKSATDPQVNAPEPTAGLLASAGLCLLLATFAATRHRRRVAG